MARSKRSKTKHDSTVRKVAKQYKEKGYQVNADVKDWDRPDTISGLRPDLIVQKSGHQTVVEVETPDSLDSKRDLQQQKAFEKWSKKSSSKHYKRIVTEK